MTVSISTSLSSGWEWEEDSGVLRPSDRRLAPAASPAGPLSGLHRPGAGGGGHSAQGSGPLVTGQEGSEENGWQSR